MSPNQHKAGMLLHPGVELGAMVVGKNAFNQFVSRTDQLEWANAYLCMYTSRITSPAMVGLVDRPYAIPQFRTVVQNILRTWGMGRTTFLTASETAAQVIITSNRQVVLVAFRGLDLEDIRRFWSNGHSHPVGGTEWGNGRIHVGFAKTTHALWPKLVAHLQTHQDNHQPIWLTGHGTGGALAVLVAYQLAQSGFEVQGIYTYGQPVVADTRFMFAFYDLLPAHAYHRFVHHVDPVPELLPRPAATTPLGVTEGNYRHFGQLVYIRRNGSVVLNPRRETIKQDQGDGSFRFDLADPLVSQMDAHDTLWYVVRIYRELPQLIRATMPVPALVPLGAA